MVISCICLITRLPSVAIDGIVTALQASQTLADAAVALMVTLSSVKYCLFGSTHQHDTVSGRVLKMLTFILASGNEPMRCYLKQDVRAGPAKIQIVTKTCQFSIFSLLFSLNNLENRKQPRKSQDLISPVKKIQ